MYFLLNIKDINQHLPPKNTIRLLVFCMVLSIFFAGYAFYCYKKVYDLKNQLQQYQQITVSTKQNMSLQKHKLKNSHLFETENRVSLLQALEKLEQRKVISANWQLRFSIADRHKQDLWQTTTVTLEIGLQKEKQLFELLDFLTQREGVLSPTRCHIQRLETETAMADCHLQWLTVSAAGQQAFND